MAGENNLTLPLSNSAIEIDEFRRIVIKKIEDILTEIEDLKTRVTALETP